MDEALILVGIFALFGAFLIFLSEVVLWGDRKTKPITPPPPAPVAPSPTTPTASPVKNTAILACLPAPVAPPPEVPKPTHASPLPAPPQAKPEVRTNPREEAPKVTPETKNPPGAIKCPSLSLLDETLADLDVLDKEPILPPEPKPKPAEGGGRQKKVRTIRIEEQIKLVKARTPKGVQKKKGGK